MRVRPLFLLFAGLSACAPTYQPAPPGPSAAQYEALRVRAEREAREREEAARKAREQQEAARSWRSFYETHPILKGREKCVSRALNTLSDKTWENLARAAISFCVAPPPPVDDSRTWLKVATRDGGRSHYIDVGRLELREGQQVGFWVLEEFFDEDADFILARELADCDRKFYADLQLVYITSGTYQESMTPPLNWRSPLPNSMGEADLTAACTARAALLKPAPPASPHAPVSDSQPKSDPEI